MEILRTLAIAVLVFVLGVGSGWAIKSSRVSIDRANANTEVANETIKTEREIVYVTQDVVKEVVKEKIVYRDIVKTQDREVIKYVQTPAASLDFTDPEWVRLYNASSLACDPTTDTCRAKSEISGTVTRAEALIIAQEQHQLYQACRINNDGLIDFYNRVREAYNKGELNADYTSQPASSSGQ